MNNLIQPLVTISVGKCLSAQLSSIEHAPVVDDLFTELLKQLPPYRGLLDDAVANLVCIDDRRPSSAKILNEAGFPSSDTASDSDKHERTGSLYIR